jgi:hypothetical protein
MADLENDIATCTDINCTLLPLGFFLLAVDSYFDLHWVLWPSKKTATALREYYTKLLTPTVRPLPYPGYWFPVYVIYKLCIQCSTIYNFLLLALFLPITYGYVRLLKNNGDRNSDKKVLENWWIVVVLRIGLAIVNAYALKIHGNCNLDHAYGFWTGR